MADQINVNAIANTLQTKVDLPDGVSQGQCDFVIVRKTPTAQDPTWYRIYKSGWVEQGGKTGVMASNAITTITFHIPMIDTNYTVTACERYDGGTSDNNNENYWISTLNTSSIGIYNSAGGYKQLYWEVKGFAANTKLDEGDDEATLGNVYKNYFYMNGKPDYTKGENKTAGTTYIADKNGILEIWTTKNTTNSATTTVTVNGVSIDYPVDNYGDGGIYREIHIGDIYSASTSGSIDSMIFFPYDESAPSTDITITTLIDAIYPVGSIYIGTTVNCPIASIVGTWKKIDEDLVLQSSSSTHQAGTTIAAGLPNATGYTHYAVNTGYSGGDGVFSNGGKSSCGYGGSGTYSTFRDYFDLSRGGADPIYGKSDTVQPPAYVVNIWQRIA